MNTATNTSPLERIVSLRTREGGEIAPLDCPLRNGLPTIAICRYCVHVTDGCRSITKRLANTDDGRRCVVECYGFEPAS